MQILAGHATWQGSKKKERGEGREEIGRENGNRGRNEAKVEQLEGIGQIRT